MTARGKHVSTLWRQTAFSVALACIFAANQAKANGTAPTVVAGQASFSTLGSSLNISNSPGTIINWQRFSIGTNETTRFIQQSAASSVLNRVIGSDPSVILGTLISNGRVFLINPSGILFGQGARIDVAGLVASTLDLSNQDFLAGHLNFAPNPLAGKVENQGSITTPSGGNIYLVGTNVTNSGIINSPQGDVILAAGQSVNIFDSSTPGVRVEITANDNAAINLGEILAQSGQVGIYGAALQNSGIINADQVGRDASGKIVLRAKQDVTLATGSSLSANGEQGGTITIQSDTGTTLVSGTIDANSTGTGQSGGTVQILGDKVGLFGGHINASGDAGGGTVLVGGTLHGTNSTVQNATATYLSADSTITADAITNGNGGTVVLWANDSTRAYGSITARGGAQGGDGGSIETSGHWLDVSGININAGAPNGKRGTWLLDPADVTITGAVDSGGSYSGVNPYVFAPNPGTSASNVNVTTITTALLSTDVTITTANTSGSGSGNISVDAAISWDRSAYPASPTILTLSAVGNVNVNAAITATNGSLVANAGHNVNVNAGAVITTTDGNVALRAGNDGTGGGTVSFGVGAGIVVTRGAASIYYNPGSYATPTDYSGNFTLTNSTLNSYMWVFAQGNNKIYDSLTTASLSFIGTPTLGGTVILSPGTADFDTRNAGTGKTVSYSGYSLGGADANKFALFSSAGSTTANITPAPVTLTAPAVSKVYDGSTAYTAVAGDLTTLSAPLIAGDTVTAATIAYTNANAGTANKTTNLNSATINDGNGGGNYTVSLLGNITSTITPAALTVSSADVTKTYDGTLVALGTATVSSGSLYTNASNGGAQDTLSSGTFGFINANAGTGKTVNVSGISVNDGNGSNNYTVTQADNITSTINKAALTISTTNVSKTYNGPLNMVGATGQGAVVTLGTLYTNANTSTLDSISGGTFAFTNANAGVGNKTVTTTNVTVNDSNAGGNYIVTYADNTASTINKTALTITANSASKIYGAPNPTLGVSYSAFANGDTAASLTTQAAANTTAPASSNVGSYAITASGALDPNYTIAYVGGTLTVNPASLTVTANNASKTYGAANPILGVSYSAFANGDTAASLTTQAAANTTAPASSNVGSYAITASGALDPNYTIAYVSGALTVNPASLMVTANAKSKVFGTSDPALTFSVTGLVNNPALGIADTAGTVFSGALTRASGETVLGGPYAITQGSLAANSNYTLGFTHSYLTINSLTTAPIPGTGAGATAMPIFGFNAGQAIFTGVINNEFYYRPGNFWHISLNSDDADPGFDVMRGTNDLDARFGRSSNSCDGVLCATWSFPQQFEKADQK
jgi:filamentous hemagglutinin family protein